MKTSLFFSLSISPEANPLPVLSGCESFLIDSRSRNGIQYYYCFLLQSQCSCKNQENICFQLTAAALNSRRIAHVRSTVREENMQIVQCHTRLEYFWAHFCSKEHNSKKQRVVRKKSSFFNSDSVWLQSATTASICATSEEQTIKCPLIRLIAPPCLACLLAFFDGLKQNIVHFVHSRLDTI